MTPPANGDVNHLADLTGNDGADADSIPDSGAYSADESGAAPDDIPVEARLFADDDSPGLAPADDASFLDDITQRYLHDIGGSQLLTAEEEKSLARLTRAGDFAARQRMIESNLRLVVSIARRYQNRGLPLDDLIEEGNLGLIHAIEKFDPERGFRLSTYATWWIRQSVERALMNQSRTVRLPIYVIRELNMVLRALRQLEQQSGWTGEAPHPGHEAEAVARLLDRPSDEVRHLLSLNERPSSLDAPLGIDPELSVGDAIADEHSEDPEAHLAQQEVEAHVAQWVSRLNERQRYVVECRYGLNGREPLTLEAVADDLGLTRERVRQIQLDALMALRKMIRRSGADHDALL